MSDHGDRSIASGVLSGAGSNVHQQGFGVPGKATLTESLEEAPDGGRPLPAALRRRFEQTLGADLSEVRVHDDSRADAKAKAVGARAFATGNDIFFASGEYQPGNPAKHELIAHEVAHTLQQRGATRRVQGKSHVPGAGDRAEVEADRAAEAMVEGRPAAVTSAPAAIMRKEYSRQELLDAYNKALAQSQWTECANRLNGFADGDIEMLVEKMSFGQRTHIREAAVAAMPTWHQRVTDVIDRIDPEAKPIAERYAAYEQAVQVAKAGGSWKPVADRLNGMGDWDIQDRLKKLDWFQLMAIKDATDNKRIIQHVLKADAARSERSRQAYLQAIASSDWDTAARQLNGFNDEGIRSSLTALKGQENGTSKLAYLRTAAVRQMPDHHQRVTKVIDELIGDEKPDLNQIPYSESVPLPNVDADQRPLADISCANFGDNAAVRSFFEALAKVYGERQAASTKKPETQEAETKKRFAQYLDEFAKQGASMIDAKNPKTYNPYFKTFAQFARAYMSEMRELNDAQTLAPWHGKMYSVQLPSEPGALVDLARGDSGGGTQVHPFVNELIKALDGKGIAYDPSTYKTHGPTPAWYPYCLDVKPHIGRDDRGLYPREKVFEFFLKIDEAVRECGGDWSSCYDDYSVATKVNERFGNRVAFQAQPGSRNFHGAMNLHIHLNLSPRSGGPGDARSAGAVNEAPH